MLTYQALGPKPPETSAADRMVADGVTASGAPQSLTICQPVSRPGLRAAIVGHATKRRMTVACAF